MMKPAYAAHTHNITDCCCQEFIPGNDILIINPLFVYNIFKPQKVFITILVKYFVCKLT